MGAHYAERAYLRAGCRCAACTLRGTLDIARTANYMSLTRTAFGIF